MSITTDNPLTNRFIPDVVADSTKLLSDSDKDETTGYQTESFKQRCLSFLSEPSIRALTICNGYFGGVCTLFIIVPMCISNTYENRHLIPILGGTVGVSRLITTGLFDWMAKMTSYMTLQYLQTLATVSWVGLMFLVFPNNSLHQLTPGDMPIFSMGDWVVYLLGLLIGCALTWLGVLVTVATGKVSTDTQVMQGFQPDVLFAYCMIVWSIGSSVTLAITPYVTLYMFACLTFIGVFVNHFCFCYDLLPFIGRFVLRNVDDNPISY